MIIDAAGERSEQGRFLSKGPDSSNAVLGRRAHQDQTRGWKSAKTIHPRTPASRCIRGPWDRSVDAPFDGAAADRVAEKAGEKNLEATVDEADVYPK